MFPLQHVCTTNGAVRSNDQVERANRCVTDILAKLSSEKSAKCYTCKYVPRVQMEINSLVHSIRLSTPFEILFGTKICNKMDHLLLGILLDRMLQLGVIEKSSSA